MSDRPDKPYDWHEYAIKLEKSLIEQNKRIAELEQANTKLTVIATNFQTGIDMVRALDTGTAWVSKRPSYKDSLHAWEPIHRAEQMLKGGDS